MLGPIETALIGILLVVLMFGMGSTLVVERFREVLRHPQAFLVGTASQFLFMPALAYALSKALSLPDESALGLVVMGTCPGGAASNLFAHLSRADLALSVSMTAASKVIGIVMIPVSLYVFGRDFTSSELAIPYGDVVKTLVFLLVPVAIGMVLRARFGEPFARVTEKVGSIAGIAVIALLVAVGVSRNHHLFASIPVAGYIAAIGLSSFGMIFGDLASRAFGLPVDKRRAVSFETGIQNSPLCFAILITTFPPEAQEGLLRLPLLYALFVLIVASVVTGFYRITDARDANVETA